MSVCDIMKEYSSLKDDIESLLIIIQQKVDNKIPENCKDVDWAAVGDLIFVRDELNKICQYLR